MLGVPFILVFTTVFVLQICVSDHIDDARVAFTVSNEKYNDDWNRLFDSLAARQNRMEKCEQFTKNVLANVSCDASPCVHVTMATRLVPSGKLLTLGDQHQLEASRFNSSNRLIIILHGFFQNRRYWMETTKNALLSYEDCNVVIVDWSSLSMNVYYPLVTLYAFKVAEYVGQFIDFFVDEGTPLENIHLVGHSLGAHMAGVASQKSTKGIVGRITGLDAARPLFVAFENELRLEKSDAHFVDCIHTSGGYVGMPYPFCHADFFVNGGRVQPGCPEFISLGRCGHLRSTKYFIESISHSVRYDAYKCATTSHVDPITCWGEGSTMGYPANKSHQGIFYVKTGVRPPFHTASSKRELELADVDTLNPLAGPIYKIFTTIFNTY
uniref:Lipase member H n=1 Tax=Lygus hesperus TaxID=30085 RepID=A0A0A9W7S6_LYGHE